MGHEMQITLMPLSKKSFAQTQWRLSSSCRDRMCTGVLGVVFTLAMPVPSAVGCGSEMLELDCHLTLDGHVVVSHDNNLLRQTGHDINISSLKLQVRGWSHHDTVLHLWLMLINHTPPPLILFNHLHQFYLTV